MRTNRRSSLNALMPAAGLGPAIVRGGAVFAAAVCGGCLYTSIPAQAGPSAKYPRPAAAQTAQPPNDQSTNKQQTETVQNPASAQSTGGNP